MSPTASNWLPERHEPLEAPAWSAAHARDALGTAGVLTGRNSPWTGDVGLGVYLCACLEPSARWEHF